MVSGNSRDHVRNSNSRNAAAASKNAIDFLEREIVAIESELLSGALKSKEAVEGHIYAVNSKISEMKNT